jgi:antitoxin component of RelBE/YafQ-DinJ toxin-antitoxin module
MQTTLRIDDELYREAKAEAAKQGITITRFIEEALRLRLERRPASGVPVELPTFTSEPGFDYSPAELKRLMQESEQKRDLTKLQD